jgi:hypothetical protein
VDLVNFRDDWIVNVVPLTLRRRGGVSEDVTIRVFRVAANFINRITMSSPSTPIASGDRIYEGWLTSTHASCAQRLNGLEGILRFELVGYEVAAVGPRGVAKELVGGRERMGSTGLNIF